MRLEVSWENSLQRQCWYWLTRGNRSRLVAFGDGVVSGAGLDFIVFTVGADFDFAEGAVQRGIGWVVTNVVLAAQLVGNLIEALFQLFIFISHFNNTASGFLRQFFHFAF